MSKIDNNTDLAEMFFTPVVKKYGSRNDVREIMYRLLRSNHHCVQYGMNAVINAAQIAMITKADITPATNELFVWVSRGQFCWHLGYRYWLRREMENGGTYWLTQPRPMTDDERKVWGIPETAVSTSICIGCGLSQSSGEIRKLWDSGVQVQAKSIREGLAVTGISYIGLDETTGKKAPPKGKTWQWVANKRAKMDTQKQLHSGMLIMDAQAIGDYSEEEAYKLVPKQEGEFANDDISLLFEQLKEEHKPQSSTVSADDGY